MNQFNPSNMHIILIGFEAHLDYRINLEILRYNFSYGDKLWITTVYNGDPDKLPSGIGENNFIYMSENRGYGLGALDAFNKGLAFASIGYRPIVAIFNFDVWFFKEDGFKLWVEEFISSGKMFGAGYLPEHGLPMTDCMIFRKEFLEKLLPIEAKVQKERLEDEKLKKMYEGTQLGFENVEEWVQNNIDAIKPGIEDHWWKYQRDGEPRYRWTEKYTLAHSHDYEERKELLKKFSTTKGKVIPEFIRS